MKWLKLDCDFRNDPKIRALIQQFGGLEACGFWTLLLAYVGANGMPECEIKLSETGVHSPILLASFCCTKPKVLLSMLDASAVLALINADRWRDDRVIYIPNMLKRVDDYTRKVRTKSGQCPEKPAVDIDIEKDIEEEQIYIPPIAPRKIGAFENVKLTEKEQAALTEKFGEIGALQRIEALSEYIASKGKKYSSHYATILSWERKNGASNNGHKTKADRNAEAARRLLHRLDIENGGSGYCGDLGADPESLLRTPKKVDG